MQKIYQHLEFKITALTPLKNLIYNKMLQIFLKL